MGSLLLGLCIALAPLAASPSPPATPRDPEVARGVRLVEEGDYDTAIVVLDTATRRLAAARGSSRDLGEGYLHLGVAYLAKGHEISAKARFREALEQARDLKLSAEKFAPKVIEIFEAARDEVARSAPRPTPATATAASPSPAAASTPAKKGGSKTVLLVAGGVAAAGAAVVLASGGGSSMDSTTAAASYRLDPSDTHALPSHGASGGVPFQLVCPAGSVVAATTGLAESFPVKVAPTCAALLANGSTGAETALTPPGVGIGVAFADRCPPSSAVVRLFGTVGQLPDGTVVLGQLGVGCAAIQEWTGGSGAVTSLAPHGVAPGTPFTETCTPGYVVTAMVGAAGGFIDRISATCTRVRR